MLVRKSVPATHDEAPDACVDPEADNVQFDVALADGTGDGELSHDATIPSPGRRGRKSSDQWRLVANQATDG
jgi:hypothetical protein